MMEAVTPTPEFAPPADGSGTWQVLYSYARSIRVDAQDLLKTLDQIEEAGVEPDAVIRKKKLDAALKVAQQRYAHSSVDIRDRLLLIRNALATYPDISDATSDAMERIGNAWERVVDGWPTAEGATPEDAPAMAKIVRPELREMILLVGLATIPSRLNRHLEQMDVGQTLVFKDEFGDELVDEEMHQKVLRFLASHPTEVPGYVNVTDGTIVRGATTFGGVSAGMVAIAVLALLPFCLLLLHKWFPTLDELLFEEGQLPNLVTAYGFVLLGAAAHFVVNIIKSQRAGQVLVIGERVRWVSTRIGGIIVTVLALWVVAYGIWRVTFPDEVGRATAFFVGYSMDSFVDLFLQRFTTTVNEKTPELEARILGQSS